LNLKLQPEAKGNLSMFARNHEPRNHLIRIEPRHYRLLAEIAQREDRSLASACGRLIDRALGVDAVITADHRDK
jgi:hypothetical protein